ncbi:MAG: hypothetical protein Q8S73_00235 [Deltaproteobacteria bacterium]|nr:hypothetical protein [Deltaproteobacteria bacterium]
MRPPDAAIPPDERLYRSVAPLGLASDGEHLLPQAVQLPSTSCNRERYADPESVLVAERPADTGVAAVCGRDLPPASQSPGGVTYGWRADDVPLDENDAHAEVRLLRDGQYVEGHRPASKLFQHQLREQLALRFRIVLAPR